MKKLQNNLIKNLTANYSNPNEIKSQEQILLDSGYSSSSARQSTRIIKSPTIQNALAPIKNKLKSEIKKVMKELSIRNIKSEKYFILIKSLEILIKQHQLLTGNTTDNVSVMGVVGLANSIKALAEEKDE